MKLLKEIFEEKTLSTHKDIRIDSNHCWLSTVSEIGREDNEFFKLMVSSKFIKFILILFDISWHKTFIADL